MGVTYQTGNSDIGDFTDSLWKAANKLRGSVESAEYKHIVLGLLFLKYISDAFEERHDFLVKETHNPGNPDYYCVKEAQSTLEDAEEFLEKIKEILGGLDMLRLDEDTLAEQPAIEWLRELGYDYAFGPDISPGGDRPERNDFSEVILKGTLRDALKRLNQNLPQEAWDDAVQQLLHLDSPNFFERNRAFHRMAVNEVRVICRDLEGEERGDLARVFDFEDPENNDFLFIPNKDRYEGAEIYCKSGDRKASILAIFASRLHIMADGLYHAEFEF